MKSIQEMSLSITLEETNKILAALGHLPYIQVHELIHKIQRQAQAQLKGLDESVMEEIPAANGKDTVS